ncbi:carbohydrate kinase family protein [uncultured Schumannella sp.]|uniref:carbohydrate kinase family protein n=1 Tax=uncultured Schumannella sp. TaxID=1195956 RepID=UPI0025F388EF|nr:PfkB family carbohydrate kinase [uncultured Schumannella sp.]
MSARPDSSSRVGAVGGSAGPMALVVGHVCVDLTPGLDSLPSLVPGDLSAVGELRMTPGGCVANTGGDLAELEVSVAVCADIGDDELSVPLRRLAAGRGLDIRGFRTTAATTSYSIVFQPPGRDRTFWHHTGANTLFDGTHVVLDGVDLLHIGYPSLLPALVAEKGRPLVALLDRARASGITTSLDLAVVDAPTKQTRMFWDEVLTAALPSTDIVSPSIDDLASALGSDALGDGTPLAAAQLLVDRGAAIAVVSDGVRGFGFTTADAARFARSGSAVAGLPSAWYDRRETVPASTVTVPVTTTGAGDAATAGLLAAVLRGTAPDAAVRFAADVAAARVAGLPLATVAAGHPSDLESALRSS